MDLWPPGPALALWLEAFLDVATGWMSDRDAPITRRSSLSLGGLTAPHHSRLANQQDKRDGHQVDEQGIVNVVTQH